MIASNREIVLPDDDLAARDYARLQQTRRAAGPPLSVEDGMIAAICVVAGARLATRNTGDFEGLGIGLLDPWRRAAEYAAPVRRRCRHAGGATAVMEAR